MAKNNWYDYAPFAFGGLAGLAGRSLFREAYPTYSPLEFQRSPATEQALEQLRALLEGQDLRRAMQESIAQQLGAAQTRGYRQLTSRITDPALLQNALLRLQSATGEAITSAGQRAADLQQRLRTTGIGQLSQIGGREEQLRQMIDEINLQQRQRQQGFWQDLLAGLISGGAQFGGALLGSSGGGSPFNV